jgi:hypothetical protein
MCSVFLSITPVSSRVLGFVLSLLLLACIPNDSTSDGRCPVSKCGPVVNRASLFPMAVGNEWVFADSITDSSSPSETFVIKMTSWRAGTYSEPEHESVSIVHWDVQVYGPVSGTRTYDWIDSSYSQYQDEVSGTRWKSGLARLGLIYVVPQTLDTMFVQGPFWGDTNVFYSAVRLHEAITVPAGTFSDCIAYSIETNPKFRTVLCPQVGWISFDQGSRRMRLTKYVLIP